MTQPIAFRPHRAFEQITAAGAVTNGKAKSEPAHPAPVPIARLTGLVRALASEGPPVDHARIAQIRQAIASGSYRPDAEAVADAMLHHYGWTGP